MKFKRIIWVIALLLLTLIVGCQGYRSTTKCKNDCIEDGWEDGKCEWPRNMNETYWSIHAKSQIEKYNWTFPYSEIENRGPCVEAFLGHKSAHCGNKGQCNCYCFDYKEGVLE